MKTRIPAGWNRARRRAGFDRTKMRRREDRVQTSVGVLLVIAFLTALPLGLIAVCGPIYSAGVRAESANAATRHSVTAQIYDPGQKSKDLRVSWHDTDGT